MSLTDIPGIRVGHVSDYEAITGCTAILCEQGAVGGVDIRGSASGTEETPTLSPVHVDPVAHGILPGGRQRFRAGGGLRGAALPGDSAARAWSTPAGQRADCAGGHLLRSGDRQGARAPGPGHGRSGGGGGHRGTRWRKDRVGAGTGATVGKMLGMRQAMKSGLGSYTVDASGRRAGGRPGGGERVRRRARPGHRQDCGRRARGAGEPRIRRTRRRF